MSDNEIEARGYNPKEVRDLVKNKEEMEKLDKIMPKNLRYEQVTQVLEIDNEVDDNQEKPEEKPVETKEDNNQKESWETADILI
ncbi:hypothetical protein II582_00395 [bacterium]|nr:hypothetical protein [bacterium]